MNISVEKAKEIREQIGATHLILFAHGPDGEQNVSTHGLTEQQAHEAADFGNALKRAMGWPEELCKSTPEQRTDWNRKTVSQIKEQIEVLKKQGEHYADQLGEMTWNPDNEEEMNSLSVSVAQIRFAVEQLEEVIAGEGQQ